MVGTNGMRVCRDFELGSSRCLESWVNAYPDVDTAVTTEGQDHTGGRGPKGSITKQLDDANVEELLKSAV